jgi:hypothetical protein
VGFVPPGGEMMTLTTPPTAFLYYPGMRIIPASTDESNSIAFADTPPLGLYPQTE